VYFHGDGRKMLQRSRMTRFLWTLAVLLLGARGLAAQNVLTQHNDIARTGANTSETILTPANVNTSAFGKLFNYGVDGYVYAQPLYMGGVTMGAGTPQAGTKHNVVFVATEHDSVYALDGDGNLGANAKPLWQITLLDAAHGAAAGAIPMPASDLNSTDIVPEIGITSTPVIDPVSKTIYVVGKTKESGTYVQRLHALDITTGAEKFGGPKVITASVPGNGATSSGGTLQFDTKWHLQRPGLLLLNGVVYIGFGAHQDFNTWHGWVLAYNASTLAQVGAWCATPNGQLGGLWMSGAGLAAEVPDPTNRPYGRMFVPTGNGSYGTGSPNFNYSDSILRLDLANGKPVVGDFFTPHDQTSLDLNDLDVSSAGLLLLPDAVGGGKHLLIQAGKSGAVYLLDRDALGGYHPGTTPDPEQKATVGGMWSMPAYWNGHVYFWGKGDYLKSFSIGNGVLSANPTSTGTQYSGFPGSVPTVSANGTSNGIVWDIRTDNYASQGTEILYAFDASNVANLLYSSGQNVARDNPGGSVKFAVPTITNGKVYVGAAYQVNVFGLLNGQTQAAAPVMNPAGGNFNPSVQVTITDSSPNAQIFFTTDGSTPTTASSIYSEPITVTKTETIRAIAGGPVYLASVPSSNTYTLVTQVPMPTFNPAPGDYSSPQSVTITTSFAGAKIYYTTDGTTPTSGSTLYTGPVAINTSETLKAIATAPNVGNSAVAAGLYNIVSNSASSINFGSGFTPGGMVLVGKTSLSGKRLRLTNGGTFQASAAWCPAKVNVQSFSTDFEFQLTAGSTAMLADGFTFAMQGVGTTPLGPAGGGLAYGASTPGGAPGIAKSVAVKFDLYSNAGEGVNSTGLYTNGASPTTPATTLGGGVNLHNPNIFHVHMTYNGTTLTMTITDTANSASTFTTSWPVNIPNLVGGSTAYAGFTAGTGGSVAIQDILDWTFVSNSSGPPPAATPVITPSSGTYTSAQTVSITDGTSGATIYYTVDGSQPTTSSNQYTGTFPVNTTTTVKAIATAPTFSTSAMATSTIAIQKGTTAINFGSGFTQTGMQFNGHTKINGTRLQLTDTVTKFEVASAYFNTQVNVQSFTSDFNFQLNTPTADGFTFTIQNSALTAMGIAGGGLGYGPSTPTGTPGIPKSVAVKFDLYNNAGEGTNSTGLYTNGASPTAPATTLGGGVNLHSGNIFHVHLAYDGTTLIMTITDTVTTANTFTTSWPIDIPATVGANTAFVGFTGATGGYMATQEILTWIYGN
jgi:hypothetical protein